jgi:mannan endo-1,4-beta-mannosidase
MKLLKAVSLVLGLAEYATAATSFAGSNLYYAAGLTSSQQTTLFTGLKDAGVQVLRVWLDGKSLPTSLFAAVTSLMQDAHNSPNTTQVNPPPKKALK